jgi:transcriptional regulator with XRE-family HTH domain
MKESVVTAGSKIKSVREIKSLDTATVSERTGIPAEQLELIEQGEIPSLTPLIKIARALGVRVGTFLDDAESDGPIVCTAEEQHRGVRFALSNDAATHLNYYSLARTKSGRYMEPFFIEIKAGESSETHVSSHEGEEFIYCLEGELEVVYGQKTYTLKRGDSIYYDSIVEHGVRAIRESAKILAVLYAPV